MRVTSWLWGRARTAEAVRLGLYPACLMFSAAVAARRSGYRQGWLRRHDLSLPAVSVGNLTVGGTGKTPIAAWVAGFFTRRGARAAILLRGYGGDEGEIHRLANPGALVVEGGDRVRGANIARFAGADLIVMDDAFQHLRVRRDLDLVIVSAESLAESRWPLPAGPWREQGDALKRAAMVIVTRRRASVGDSLQASDWVRSHGGDELPVARAELALGRLVGMWSNRSVPASALRGTTLLAIAGIADPASFESQLSNLGAQVQLQARRDHCRYSRQEIERLAVAGSKMDWVLVTAKDAVKLRHHWPRHAPEPLVAEVDVRWEAGQVELERVLANVWDGGGESRHNR